MEDERLSHGKPVMEIKVPGGKLVRMSMEDGGRISISGDFFVHPEEGLEAIEDALSGLEEGDARAVLSSLVRDMGIQLVGFDVDVLARLYEGIRHVENNWP
jgi:lipoate-protein ligase A